MVVNSFEIVMLSLALVLALWINGLIAGSTLTSHKLKSMSVFGAIFIGVQILMVGAGLWVGNRIGIPDIKANLMMAIGILLIFGLKILFTSVKNNPQNKIYDYSDASVVSLSAIGEGINTFGLGLVLGLLSESIFNPWLIFSLVLAIGLIVSLLLGSILKNDAIKLRLGPIGGLILIALAIKFAITLAGL